MLTKERIKKTEQNFNSYVNIKICDFNAETKNIAHKKQKAYKQKMNNIIQKMNIRNLALKIDRKATEVMVQLSKHPNKAVTTDFLFKNLVKQGFKTNYVTIFRRVQTLINQDFIKKEKYGAANQLRLNLENETTILLLSLIENNKKQSFLGSLKGSKRTNLEKAIKNLNALDKTYSVLLFGSYAKGKANDSSDLDILVIAKRLNDASKIKISSIFKNIELRTNIEINSIFLNLVEYCEMLKNNQNNVGKESLSEHIILIGEYNFWRGIAKCYQKEN